MLPTQQSSSLSAEQLQQLQQLTTSYSPLQLAWASGYLAAKSEQAPATAGAAITQASAPAGITVLYASQTGNAKGVASQLVEQAKAAGLTISLKNVADYKPKSLKDEQFLVIVSSTNGEGEPPDDALLFHEFLLSKKAPKVAQLNYAVLALGDSSYEFFCQTGKDFDNRLAELGASRLVERVDCDVDYQADADAWIAQVVAELNKVTNASNTATTALPATQTVVASQYSKQNPFETQVLVSQKITGRDSNKDVRHVEIDLADSGIQYQVGDALGVYFENKPELVAELLKLTELDGASQIQVADKNLSLTEALTQQLELTQGNAKFVEFWANYTQDAELLSIIANKAQLRAYANAHQIIDVIAHAPKAIEPQLLVAQLRAITPRLYSIASAQAEVGEEVHLTVGLVKFNQGEQVRFGGASSFLADAEQHGKNIRVFVEHNDNFKLPQDNNAPVIMIGPGTGIAPFRAFMQQRDADEASGKNWLFFGDQTFTQDFLYQTEWYRYLDNGLLTKMDVAFSRDQAEKIYVQHRLRQHAQELYQWLEQGAYVYVCGDATHMAKDVHQALVDIVAEQGSLSQEQAEDYLKQLRVNKRYQRDVY